jgi:hypothetical protein
MLNEIRTNPEQIPTIEEEIGAFETELSDQEKIDIEKLTSTRDRVFFVCEKLKRENKNITRDGVRVIAKGSNRDVGKYIKEWKAIQDAGILNEDSEDNILDLDSDIKNTDTPEIAGKLAVQGNNDIVHQNQNENNIQNNSEVLETTPINSYNDPDNVAEIAISALNRAKGMVLAEEKIVQHFFKNPNLMPEEFKREIAQAKSETSTMINERSATFEVDFFMKKALMSLEK